MRDRERLRRIWRAAHAVGAAGLLAAAAALFASLPARAESAPPMADALALCVDNSLSLSARGTSFEETGWTRSNDMALADAALADAILLSFLRPEDPATWDDSQARSRQTAARLRERRGHDGVQFFIRGDEAVVVEPNADGLPSCLYTGPPQSLSHVAELVRVRNVVDFGPQVFVQGRAPAAVVVAYSMIPEAMERFTEPPRFGSTFTTLLDRRAAP